MDRLSPGLPFPPFFQGCLCRRMFTPCPGLRIPRSRSDANTMCADGLPSNAVAWCAGLVVGLILCSACFAGNGVHQTLPYRSAPLFARRECFSSSSHSDGWNRSGNHLVVQTGRHTAPGLSTETCKRCLWALPALRAWETPVPAPLGYMSKAHSDMRPGQAGRSPVSQAAAQPRDSQPTASHQLGAALLQCVY